MWSLRSFGAPSIGLVLVWLFYYVGSQAQKAEYSQAVSEPFRFMDGRRPEMDQLTRAMNEKLIVTASYIEATSKLNHPYDLWGAPLTPIVEVQADKNVSYSDSDTLDKQQYTSYSGLNIYLRNAPDATRVEYQDISGYRHFCYPGHLL